MGAATENEALQMAAVAFDVRSEICACVYSHFLMFAEKQQSAARK